MQLIVQLLYMQDFLLFMLQLPGWTYTMLNNAGEGQMLEDCWRAHHVQELNHSVLQQFLFLSF